MEEEVNIKNSDSEKGKAAVQRIDIWTSGVLLAKEDPDDDFYVKRTVELTNVGSTDDSESIKLALNELEDKDYISGGIDEEGNIYWGHEVFHTHLNQLSGKELIPFQVSKLDKSQFVLVSTDKRANGELNNKLTEWVTQGIQEGQSLRSPKANLKPDEKLIKNLNNF